MLERNGGDFLVGGRFTSADLTFASMAAPVCLPPEYGADISALVSCCYPDDFVKEMREYPAGRHCMAMFQKYRLKKEIEGSMSKM